MNPIETIKGKIAHVDETGRMVIEAHYDNWQLLTKRGYKDVEITLIDSRPLSDKQRKMCWALVGEIAEWQGEERLNSHKDLVSVAMKWSYIANLGETTAKLFSLSNAPMSLIAGYQRFLIRFILEHNVPVSLPLYKYVDDIADYVYQCLIYKKCAVCGAAAELHHIDRVGMGRNREEIIHEGMECIPLCRKHHDEAHVLGHAEFMAKYHFDGGIVLDKTLCRIYRLKVQKPQNA